MSKKRGLPVVPVSKDRALTQILSAMKEDIERWQGHRGTPTDGVVTWGDLKDAGVIRFKKGLRQGTPINPSDASPTTTEPDLSTPSAIRGFQGVGLSGGAHLLWDDPKASNHLHDHVVIYRADTDDIESAAIIGRDLGASYFDQTTSQNQTYFYWVRSVSKAGVEGPLSATAGLEITIPKTADSILDEISGQILQSHLAQSLQSEIEKIAVNGTAISDEVTIREQADNALAQSIQTISSKVDGNTSAIQNESTARSNADSALAQSIQTVQTDLGGNIASVQQTVQTQGQTINSQGQTIYTLSAMWEVKTNVNGLTAGFGLFNDGTHSSFAVSASQFYVFDPASNTATLPFVIQNGKTYMDTAVIRDASIDEGKLGNITFGKLVDSNGNSITTVAGKLKADYIDVGNLTVSKAATFTDTAQSSTYSSSTGWILYQNGTAIFNNATIRGTIYASNGEFNGTVKTNKINLENAEVKGDRATAKTSILYPAIFGTGPNEWTPGNLKNGLYLAEFYFDDSRSAANDYNTISTKHGGVIELYGSLRMSSGTGRYFKIAAVAFKGSTPYYKQTTLSSRSPIGHIGTNAVNLVVNLFNFDYQDVFGINRLTTNVFEYDAIAIYLVSVDDNNVAVDANLVSGSLFMRYRNS